MGCEPLERLGHGTVELSLPNVATLAEAIERPDRPLFVGRKASLPARRAAFRAERRGKPRDTLADDTMPKACLTVAPPLTWGYDMKRGWTLPEGKYDPSFSDWLEEAKTKPIILKR